MFGWVIQIGQLSLIGCTDCSPFCKSPLRYWWIPASEAHCFTLRRSLLGRLALRARSLRNLPLGGLELSFWGIDLTLVFFGCLAGSSLGFLLYLFNLFLILCLSLTSFGFCLFALTLRASFSLSFLVAPAFPLLPFPLLPFPLLPFPLLPFPLLPLPLLPFFFSRSSSTCDSPRNCSIRETGAFRGSKLKTKFSSHVRFWKTEFHKLKIS